MALSSLPMALIERKAPAAKQEEASAALTPPSMSDPLLSDPNINEGRDMSSTPPVHTICWGTQVDCGRIQNVCMIRCRRKHCDYLQTSQGNRDICTCCYYSHSHSCIVATGGASVFSRMGIAGLRDTGRIFLPSGLHFDQWSSNHWHGKEELVSCMQHSSGTLQEHEHRRTGR
jgi:hypothetical protein